MITKNFKLGLQSISMSTSTQANMKNVSGTTGSISAYNLFNDSNRKIIFGSGTTTPTVNDYKMSTPITTLTDVSVGNLPHNNADSYDDVSYGMYTTQTVKNDTESDITINEIGITGYSTNGTTNILLCREVLDTPVVIEPNQSYSFTVTIG